MTQQVTDIRSNLPEQIQNAVALIGKSVQKLEIFKAIYKGQKQIKTTEDLMGAVFQEKESISRETRILNIANFFYQNGIIQREKDKKKGKYVFKKVKFISCHYKKIIDLVENPHKQKKQITKRTPASTIVKTVRYKNPINICQVTVDNLDNFSKVGTIQKSNIASSKILERKIKEGFAKIIGENDIDNDWGGEKNDLFTTRTILNKKRISCAIAFKGRATKGKLTPKKLGKNGDQINRLFGSSAQLFLVVYHSNIDESVLESMKAFAIAASLSGQKIYYGIIDGEDLNKIVAAYSSFF